MSAKDEDRIEVPRGEVEIIPPGQERASRDGWREAEADWTSQSRVKMFRLGPFATAAIGIVAFGVFALLLIFFASALAILLGAAAIGGALAYVGRKIGLLGR